MNNLILVRHGQSKFNLERRFTGFYDVDLTSKGKDEAKYAGELIKKQNIQFDAYFTSELIRAFDSLNIILKVLNISNAKINKAWELNERHYGGLTGLNKDETIKKYGIKQVKIWRRSFDIPPPKMEFKRMGKGTNNMLLTVTTYGNKNGKKAVVPLSGIYGKLEEEQPEKRIGNRRVVKYSFEMDEPQFGETTEIRIKVVDKYKKETVSDNEFEYYD